MLAICQQFPVRKNWICWAKIKRVRSDEEGMRGGGRQGRFCVGPQHIRLGDSVGQLGSGNYLLQDPGRPGVGFDLEFGRILLLNSGLDGMAGDRSGARPTPTPGLYPPARAQSGHGYLLVS